MPVCSVAGCDPNKLPTFVNGRRLKVKRARNSVFKYKCNRGYRLFGPKNVYCTKNGWKLDELPVCARFGCDESSLLGDGIPHGRQRSMFQGAVYRFYCESGAMMQGNSAVYCDGYSWNGTKPECLVPPTTPVLSLELDGVETSSPLASVGQHLKLVCTSMGGNPFPDLSFMLNGEHVEADNKEMIEQGGYNAVYTITVDDTHNNMDMSCVAENRMSSIPVASNHQRLSVTFGPSNTYIHGPEQMMEGTEVDYSCTSDESDPASNITVRVTDQDGNDIAVEVTKLPKMKGNAGVASGLQFKFQVLAQYKSVLMKCQADNGVSQASSELSVHAMYAPSTVQLTGPEYLLATDDEYEPHNLVTCSTDHSNPAATIDWVVEADDMVDDITEDNTATEIISQGAGYKKISTLALPAYNTGTITVRCVSTIQDLGYSQTSDDLVLDYLGPPGEVSILGPDSVVANSVNMFECVTHEDDYDSDVSLHVSTLAGDSVNYDTESSSKISVTIQEPLTSIIVECSAKNVAGQGPVQTKIVDIHSPPTVEIEGPDQLLPFNMLTYSCLTTSPDNNIFWTVADQDGEDVEFTQYSSQASESGLESVIELYAGDGLEHIVVTCAATNKAGDAYQEIVAHTVESPASVEITAPDQTDAWSELTYKCSSPVSSPQQNIRWEVTDLYYEELEFATEDTVVEDGQVTSKVSMTLSPSARMVRVKCVAYNEVGYVEDSSQDYLTYNPDSVTLDGPGSVIAGEEAVFSCASENSFPAPSLMWTLDGQDVTRDSQQTDNQELLETGGGVSSLSKLRVNPTMGGHTHVVECFVAGTHLKTDFSFHVEDFYEDEDEDADAELMDAYEEEYEDDKSKHINEDQEHQQEGEYSNYFNNDHSSEDQEENDNKYNEDSSGVGKDGFNIALNFNKSQIEDDQTIRNDENEEDENNYYEDEYDYTDYEYDDYDGDDYKNVEDNYVQSYDNDKEANSSNEDDSDDAVEQQVYEEKTDKEEHFFEHDATEYNEHFKENIENENDYYENEASEYKESKPVDEEIFDATQQQQSFAAAEPGSAVLSHESDPSTHVSADMFSPKPLYGSAERVWCGSALIFVTICNLIRLLR